MQKNKTFEEFKNLYFKINLILIIKRTHIKKCQNKKCKF